MLLSLFYVLHLTANMSAEKASVHHFSMQNRACQGSCQTQPTMTVKSMYVLVWVFIFAFTSATWLWHLLFPVTSSFRTGPFLKLTGFLLTFETCMSDHINCKGKWHFYSTHFLLYVPYSCFTELLFKNLITEKMLAFTFYLKVTNSGINVQITYK